MNDARRTVLWRGIWLPGREWCQLTQEGDGWRLHGTVLTAVADEPIMVRYDIAADEDWATREVQIVLWSGATERTLRLSVDQERRWHALRGLAPHAALAANDSEALHGLVDVDLGFSPVTNTLPIRRLAPEVGQGVEVTAAWVRFPELTLEPLPQRYTRLADRRYRYESNDGAFVAALEVDDLGLVVTYEGGWERIATASG